MPTSSARLLRWSRRAMLALGLYAFFGGLTSFFGWVLDIPRLTDWIGNGISIQPNATLAAAGAGLGLVLLAMGFALPAGLCGGLAAVIGSTVLFQYITGLNLHIDTLFLFDRSWGRVGVISPGRMGPPGASAWSLIGVALMLISSQELRRQGAERSPAGRLPLGLAYTTAGISLLSLIGYLFGAKFLYTIPTATVIAFQTATFVFACSLGLLLSLPDRGLLRLTGEEGAAGILVRRAVPALLILPLLIGFLRVQGERAGLYDSTFGTSLRTIVEIALFLTLLWWTARAIRQEEARRLEAEMERERLLYELEERVQSRTEELARQTAELARSNADLRRFAYAASHDLQEPLRMVTSYLQIIRDDYQGKLGPDADECIGYAVEGAERMRMLINGLLAYSRVGAEGNTFAPVDCKAVLTEVLANLELAIRASDARITSEKLPIVTADHYQMVQLLQNLIANALTFRNEVEAPRIHVSATRSDKSWLFSVSDNGIGIAPKYRETVFGIFHRLHDRSKYQGTGMGLAICKRVVERRGGQIWVESEPGHGSTFYFTVPDIVVESPHVQPASTLELHVGTGNPARPT